MSEQYSEKIFKSIEEIVSARLNEVSFDKTIECTILERFEEEPSKYWATNGSINIEVYASDDKEYKVNDKVYVVIPNGDYASRKIIIGRYNADDLPKYLWSNPFDSLIYESKINIYEDQENPLTVQCNATEPAEKVLTLNNITKTDNDYNYIGLEMSFAVWLSKFQGEYRIEVILQNKNSSNIVKDLVEFSINSTELYGNPYQLTSDLKFYHLFSYPEYIRPKDINQITIRLVSAGGFSTSDADATISMPAAALYFGYDVNNVIFTETNKLTMSLASGDEGKFSNTNPEPKKLYLQWVKDKKIYSYLTPSNDFEGVKNSYKIKWYTYQYGVNTTELDTTIGGPFWVKLNTESETLEAANLYLSFTPRKGYVKELIKAVIVDSENKIIATSNVIELNDPAGPQQNPDVQGNNGLKLIFDKQNHFVYNNAGGLDLDDTPNKFNVAFKFDNSSIILLPDDQIIWRIDESGQIQGFETKDNNNNTIYTPELNNGATVSNIKDTTIFKAAYSLKSILANSGNTRVSCTIIRNNQTFAFGEGYVVTGNKNTQGTGYIFNIDFAKDSKQYITKSGSVTVKATLYRPDGTQVEIGNEDIVWSWYSVGQRFPYTGEWGDEKVEFTEYKDIELFGYEDTGKNVRRIGRSVTDDENNTTIYDEILGSDTITLKPFINSNDNWFGYIKFFDTENSQWVYDDGKVDPVFCNNYHVLMAQYKNASWATSDGGAATTTLSAYLPIPWGSSNLSFTGPDIITYNPSGTDPNYIDTPCVLFQNGEPIKFIKNDTTNDSPLRILTQNNLSIYGPQITEIIDEETGEIQQNLKPRKTIIYDNPVSCISIRNIKGQGGFYQQPIFIARNTYMFDSINKWSGQLEINEANNSIMAGFMAAGKKDMKTNKFTGVMMGDMSAQDTEGDPIIKSGIIGQKDGEDRFYLSATGEFWFGNNKGEEITFDKNGNLIIKCNNMDIKSTSFTLETGDLLLTSEPEQHDDYVFKFGNKFFFKKGGSATIAGWTIDNNILYSNQYDSTNNITNSAAIRTGGVDAFVVYTKSGDQGDAIPSYGAGWNRPFRVTYDGTLYAEKARIGSESTINGTSVTQLVTNASLEVSNNQIKAEVTQTLNNTLRNYSTTTQTSDMINAEVGTKVDINGGSSTKTSWSLTADAFTVKSNNTPVLKVTKDGLTVTGVINAKEGKIGSFKISSKYLQSEDETIGMALSKNESSGWAFWAGGTDENTVPFRVDHKGNLYARSATISENSTFIGTITASAIKGSTITGGSMELTNTAGNKFKVNKDGYLLYSDSGRIGAWYIGYTLYDSSYGVDIDGEGVSWNTSKNFTWDNVYTKIISGSSSRSIKENINNFVNQDYLDALELLKNINIYSYDYKYNFSDQKHQYGFIIDEIEEISGYNKFFNFTTTTVGVTAQNYLDFRQSKLTQLDDSQKIQIKQYNTDLFTKYLLVCIKALQQEIEILKGEKGE